MKPVWAHDCNKCIYLFSWNNQDFYRSCDHAPLLVRYGNDGPDYRTLYPDQYSEFFPGNIVSWILNDMEAL